MLVTKNKKIRHHVGEKKIHVYGIIKLASFPFSMLWCGDKLSEYKSMLLLFCGSMFACRWNSCRLTLAFLRLHNFNVCQKKNVENYSNLWCRWTSRRKLILHLEERLNFIFISNEQQRDINRRNFMTSSVPCSVTWEKNLEKFTAMKWHCRF